MGGRILAGSIQLGLAITGFVLVLGWIIGLSANAYRQAFELPVKPVAYPWMGAVGFAVFAASWVLAWFTSISLLRNAPPEKIIEVKSVPPLIKP